MTEALIYEAVRSPTGKRGGQLSDLRGDELLAQCLRALSDRTKLDPRHVGDVVGGCVTQVDEQGCNIIRQAVLAADWPVSVPGTSVNRLCGSGQQAVTFAGMEVMSGQVDFAIGCGMENMTRVPMGSDVGSFNERLDARFDLIPQGHSAELMAKRYDCARDELDRFAFMSHERACAAIEAGLFEREIAPVTLPSGERLERDEGPRFGGSLEKIQSLAPAFDPNGVITAASSSQISDGAAALLLGSRAAGDRHELRPRGRLVATAQVGVDPTMMLEGPIPATRAVLEKSGLGLADIDLFEVNEAFASVVLAWHKTLGVELERVNVNGGAIALGHPLGATGARLLCTLLHELERRQARFGLVTMCIGFGQGTATIIERLD
jgi:acetyl-CoA acyltransferase